MPLRHCLKKRRNLLSSLRTVVWITLSWPGYLLYVYHVYTRPPCVALCLVDTGSHLIVLSLSLVSLYLPYVLDMNQALDIQYVSWDADMTTHDLRHSSASYRPQEYDSCEQ